VPKGLKGEFTAELEYASQPFESKTKSTKFTIP
jgi:hypothetical protein